jgi:hypothetical protein
MLRTFKVNKDRLLVGGDVRSSKSFRESYNLLKIEINWNSLT